MCPFDVPFDVPLQCAPSLCPFRDFWELDLSIDPPLWKEKVWGLGFGVWGLGFGVWGLGFGVWGLGFGVWGWRSRAMLPFLGPVFE